MAITWGHQAPGDIFSEWPMSATISPWVLYSGVADYTIDGTAPSGDAHILRNHHYPSPPGSGPRLYAVTPDYTEAWVGLVVKQSNPFAGYPSGVNKFFWLVGTNNEWLILTAHGNESTWPTEPAYPICFTIEGTADNSHLPYKIGTSTVRLYGEHSGNFAVGQWLKIECYVKLSTTPTSQDGVVIWWVNDVEIGNYQNCNNVARSITEAQITHTWDGMTPNPYEFEWYYDHIRIVAATGPPDGEPIPTRPEGTLQLSTR